MMLAVTAICVVFCLSVDVSGDVALHSDSEPVFFLPPPPDHSVVPSAGASEKVRLPLETDAALARREGVETISGRMTLAFGAASIPVSRERSDAVHFLQLILASGIAGTFGTAADPGVDRGIRPHVPGPKCGVGPARQAHPSEKPPVYKLIESGPVFSPQLSILSLLVMTGAVLALSAHEFRTADY